MQTPGTQPAGEPNWTELMDAVHHDVSTPGQRKAGRAQVEALVASIRASETQVAASPVDGQCDDLDETGTN